MTKKILWLDNDIAYLDPYIDALRDEGYEVNTAATVSKAEYLLKTARFNLLILDVMIPTISEDEEARYNPHETDYGYKTGLTFYKLNRELFVENETQVLVMTVRLDKEIMDEFTRCGLPASCFATKFDLRDSTKFINKVRTLI